MQLVVNGKDIELNEDITIQKLLEKLQLENKVMAVAVDMEIVKKDNWNTFIPKEGSKIELLHFVGGG